MGDPKRLRKAYEVPLKQWDKERIEREGKLCEEYGLKNSRELWKAQTILRKIRREARRLLSNKGAKVDVRAENLIKRVNSFILRKQDLTLDDILALEVRDILERRLQTIVLKKRFAKSPKQARQVISHGHVSISGVKVDIPSYLVKFNEETGIDWYGDPVQIQAPEQAEDAKAPQAKAVEEAAPSAPQAA